MFKLTSTAASALNELRRQQQVPVDYGLRVSARPAEGGDVSLQIGFVEAPAPTDSIQEQHGTKVFVAEEVVEPLSEIALDANVAPSSNGSAPPELLLRPQEPGEL